MTGVQAFNKHFDDMANNKKKRKGLAFLDDFYNYILLNHESSTSYQYLHYVSNFLESENIEDPSEITLNHYTRYFVKIKDKTSSHQIATYSALKKFSKFLKINGLCEDYMENISRPKKRESAETIEKRENDYMTPKQMKSFINKVATTKKNDIWRTRDYVMIKILFSTGIRRAALQKLDVEDIDFQNHQMTVTEKGARVRKIYLSDEILDDIKKWLSYRSELGAKDDALFISTRRERMSTLNINKIFKGYDSSFHPHEARASFASTLHSKTGDLYFVQQCMGHTTPGMTERYIRGQKNDASIKAANIMNKIL